MTDRILRHPTVRRHRPAATPLLSAALGLLLCVATVTASAAQIGVLPLLNLQTDADLRSGFDAEGPHMVFMVREANQHNTDLNGDGDTLDYVIHLYRHDTGALTNLGLTVPRDPNPLRPVIRNGFMSFRVDEARQGNTDFNGDGDAHDFVTHILDLSTGALTNLGFATTFPRNTGDLVSFRVIEGEAGADLNNDGDLDDEVMHAHVLATGTTVNLGLAAPNERFPAGPFVRHSGSGPVLSFLVSEQNQGGSDLNSDGDADDVVFFTFDAVTGQTVNRGLAVLRASHARDDELFEVPVVEADQGGADLNGDGDADDVVLHLLAPASDTVVNLALAISPKNVPVSIDGLRVGFQVDEASQAGIDLNGDGDAADAVVHHYDHATGSVVNLGYGGGYSTVVGEQLFFTANERYHGSDLNGDGDATDPVTFVVDLATGAVPVSGVTGWLLRAAPDLMLLDVREYDAGDLNGDGDTDDPFKFAFNVRTGTAVNLGEASLTSLYYMTERAIGASAFERYEGIDANGDGDTDDLMMRVFDAATGEVLELGAGGPSPEVRDELVIVVVYESQEGRDLNGDGDTDDYVMHVTELPEPPPAPDQQVGDLIDLLLGLGLPHGLENSLLVKLQNALAVLQDGDPSNDLQTCNHLQSFINQVGGLSGGAIPSADAQTLIDAASAIRSSLGC